MIIIEEADLHEWDRLLLAIEEGGNDGADVYEANEFVEDMKLKYQIDSEQFNELFS